MYETGCLGLVHWDDPEGWDEEGGGRGVQDWDTCIHMDDSCQCMEKPLQYCKVISLRLKKKKESACNADLGSVPGLRRSAGEGNGYHSGILA